MSISVAYPYTFLLLLVRFTSFALTAPLLRQRFIPAPAKIGLGGLLAFLVTPLAPTPPIPAHDLVFFSALAQEIGVGLLLGFTVMLPLWAVEMAGRLIASAMGMSYATSFSPFSPDTSPPLGQLFLQLAVLMFLAVGGDRIMLLSLVHLSKAIPPGQVIPMLAQVNGDLLVRRLIHLSGEMLLAATQLALPVVGAILLSDVALVLIGRAMPRMNAFAQSLPLKVMVGLVTLVLYLPYFWPMLHGHLTQAGLWMELLFR